MSVKVLLRNSKYLEKISLDFIWKTFHILLLPELLEMMENIIGTFKMVKLKKKLIQKVHQFPGQNKPSINANPSFWGL